ncbi:MAG: alpha/beta hydrolase [Clostridia bacterium]|nr:alpha/beta hydrolase [Clostridia bacterium]
MSKKKIACTVCICLVLALLWGENYLVSFAIGRTSGTSNVGPASNLSEEAIRKIDENWQMQKQMAEEWREASPVETISVMSEDGLKLTGETVLCPDSSHWVIAVHGYRSNRKGLDGIGVYYGLRGYNVLFPDLRGCGESEGGYIGMGWLDRRDILRWIDWILEKDSGAQIVLHGVSMGGATVMMTSGEPLSPQVKAIVEDCGYTSVWDIFSDELKYLFHLPTFPFLHIAGGIAKLRAGYSFKEASALRQIEKAQVPILFIHGSEDAFVHTEMVYEVYEACRAEKQLLVVEGAGHGNSCMLDPDLYFDTVFDFLSPYVL